MTSMVNWALESIMIIPSASPVLQKSNEETRLEDNCQIPLVISDYVKIAW